jgi:hypothetical protein
MTEIHIRETINHLPQIQVFALLDLMHNSNIKE